MRVSLVTLYHENYDELAAEVLPNWREYCEKQGYDLHIYRGQYGGDQIGFQKVRYLLGLMESNAFDVALVLDLDILITRQDYRVENFIEGKDGALYVSEDVNGVNFGSWIIRNNDDGKDIVRYMLRNETRSSNEQDTVKHGKSKEPVKKHVRILPHSPSINGYIQKFYREYDRITFPNQWNIESFILHLPGLKLSDRLAIVRAFKRGDKI